MQSPLEYIGNRPAITTDDTDATSTNTPNKLVARDSSGDFSAGAVNVTSLESSGTIKSAGLKDSSDRTLVVKNAAGTVIWGN